MSNGEVQVTSVLNQQSKSVIVLFLSPQFSDMPSVIPPSSALGKSNRRLTAGSCEDSRIKKLNAVINSSAERRVTVHSRKTALGENSGLCDTTAMPQSHDIPSELLAEMTPAVRAFVTQLLARLNSLEVRLEASERRGAELEKENRDLRQRLGMNSSNSSMPPSSDRPEQTPPKIEKTSTGRKRGGQAEHVKRERELIPTE